ncbi:MAG TPA: TlpA disulfide reductase family protein [Streptosporangiaceae bacterium]|nr:TlpA disulfide reductase family protein [Streptosporangiaceae bacterium]
MSRLPAQRQPRGPRRPRLSRRTGLGAAVAVAAIMATVGCAGGDIGGNNPASSGQSFVGHSYESTYYQPASRPVAPPVSGTTVTGQHLSLSQYRGHTIVVNFWGSWCAPCRAEAPALGQLSRQLASRGVRFVGIDIRDQPDSAAAFMQQFNVGYPSINDPNDQIALDFHSTVPPADIPTTLVIDRDGRIADRIFGASTYRQLLSVINQVTGQTT